MRKKEILLKVVERAGLLPVTRRLMTLGGGVLTILAYHRVLDIGVEDAYPFDPELISATHAEFEWQMRFLREHFDVISFSRLGAHIAGGASLPARPAIVTFDDGFDDNYHFAYPVLRKLGLPATFFVSTGYVGGDTPFWFDRLAHLMMRAPVQSIFFQEVGRPLPDAADVPSRRAATGELLSAIKKQSDSRRREFLAAMEPLWEKFANHDEAHWSRPMTWAQIEEMSEHGMEFGSHTVSHPLLSKVAPEEMMRELRDSKHELERRLHKPIDTVGYPVGTADAYNDAVLAEVRSAGYQIGCSYEPGTNHLNSLDLFRLKRQHVERVTSRLFFKGLLSLPTLIN